MLAKIWKKVLFAICIIACIYNVMNKLVSRTSLEVQLNNIELNHLKNEEVYEYKRDFTSSRVDIDKKDNNKESIVVILEDN